MDRICGIVWNATPASDGILVVTACTFKTPFRVGVNFDGEEAIAGPLADRDDKDALGSVENQVWASGDGTVGEGVGYNGFYLAYFQKTC